MPNPTSTTVTPEVVTSPQDGAGDLEAEAAVEKAREAADSIFTKTDDYSRVSKASLTAAEPSLRYVTPSRNAGEVSFLVSESTDGRPAGAVALAALSSSGTCFGVIVERASETRYAQADEMTSCHARDVRRWMDVTSI